MLDQVKILLGGGGEMKTTQYILSLGNLYRTYQKNLPKINYDYLNDLIDHYSSKKNLNSDEAKKAENKCREEWKKFILLFFKNIARQIKRYKDIIEEEEKELKKIKTKIEVNSMPLGDYENEWDNLDNLYRRTISKINTDKRNFKRNWVGHIISFILGIAATLLTTYLIRRYFLW